LGHATGEEPVSWQVASENQRPGGRGKREKTMTNARNGIYVEIDSKAGSAHVGECWLPVPDAGLPQSILADPAILDVIQPCLGAAREVKPSGYVCDRTAMMLRGVQALSWDAVLVAAAAEAARRAEAAAKDAEAQVAQLAKWRAEAAAYLAGGLDQPSLYTCDHPGATDAEVIAVQAEADRRKEAKATATRTALLAALPRILAGQGEISTWSRRADCVRIDGVTYDSDIAGPEIKAQICQEYDRRQRAEAAAREAAEAAIVAERAAWIAAYGSTRLKKGLAAGLLDSMHGVYHDERIQHDLGAEWSSWKTAPEPAATERLNPSEAEIDALAEARAKWPGLDVRLQSVGGGSCDWRCALLCNCPWDLKQAAVRYLDE